MSESPTARSTQTPVPCSARGTLLFVVTEDWYFVSHRLPIAEAAARDGFRVVVATRVQRHGAQIVAAGCELRPLHWRRSGNTPWSHWSSFRELVRVLDEVRPDIVHLVALKAVVVGGFAAQWCGVSRRVSALAGLGFTFSSSGARVRVLRFLIRRMLRHLFQSPGQRVILQNADDRRFLVETGIVDEGKTRLIRGAGVSLAAHSFVQTDGDPPVVVLVARMLWAKGVGDFVQAAAALRAKGVRARFVLIGEPDLENPGAVPVAQLEEWQREGEVEWWGHRDDIPSILANASVFCLPSRYGEGIPRSLLEAAAAGLAIVTTDSPGCREVVRSGENGLLVEAGDLGQLTDALRGLLGDVALRRKLGAAARRTVQAEFSLDHVVTETLAVYHELLA